MFFIVKDLAVDGDRAHGCVTDSKSPVFSWSAEHSDNGMYQSAYRITVRTEDAQKWDSGWVEGKMQSATYIGVPLETGEELFWTLQIRDNDGNLSTVGEHFFVTAIAEAWDAPWITTPFDAEREAKYFKKTLNIGKKVKKAYLFVCGIGYFYATLNGKEINSAYLQPAVSNYKQHCYYVTIPVKKNIRLGENTLEVTVGNGWRRNYGEYLAHLDREIAFFGVPKLTAQLHIEYTDGTKEKTVTDESWLCGRGPITSQHLFDGETYDERIRTEYTDNAVVVTENAPTMRAQTIRPITAHEVYTPRVKTKVKDGYVFDFGTNIAGIVEITVPKDMPEGTEVEIYHAENILPNGELDFETVRAAKAKDSFISGGVAQTRQWSPRFTYHGFRYIYVKGWHTVLECEDIKAISLYTDIKSKSFFRCGSPVVNEIQEAIVQTEKNNLHSIATDCPQRDERMAWMNDATVRFEGMPYHFDMQRLFSKIIEDIVAEQTADGAITDTAPYVYGFYPADPVCSSFLIAAFQNYLHYGKVEDIRKHYPRFKAWNEYLKSRSENGIMSYAYYGDWAGPADCCLSFELAGSVMTPRVLMATGYHYYNFKLLQKFAEILGDEKEVAYNKKEAERVRKAFLEKWWDGESGKVDLGTPGSQAFALWLGILPKEKEALAAKVLHEGVENARYRITTGNLNTRYVMDMLAKHGYVDDAWRIMTREEYPSFGFMLQNGATTVWERFEFKRGSQMNSHDHPMHGSVGYWLYAYIAGVMPGEGGWRHFKVQPYLPKELLYAEAHVDTPYGEIYLKWQKQLESTDLLLSVPFGTSADVTLPWGETVTVCSGYHSFHGKEN